MCQESCGYSFKSIHVIPGLTITRDSFNIDTKFIELQCHKDMSEPLVGEQLVHIDTYAIFNVIISNSAYSSASGRFASAFISMSKVCILDGVVKHLLYVQRVMGSNRGHNIRLTCVFFWDFWRLSLSSSVSAGSSALFAVRDWLHMGKSEAQSGQSSNLQLPFLLWWFSYMALVVECW